MICQWRLLKDWLKRKKAIIALIPMLVLFSAVIIGLGAYVFTNYSTLTYETALQPGSVVELKRITLFFHDKVSVTEEKSVNGDKVEANVYFVNAHECTSGVRENITNMTSRFLPFTKPGGIDSFGDMDDNYLLKHSSVEFEVWVDPSSDFTNPAKICQFSDEKAFDALTGAETIAEVRDAEKKGKCFKLMESTKDTTITRHSYDIETHGYYYYAVSVFVDPDSHSTKNVSLAYSYKLKKRYYDENDFKPQPCSVVDDECSKSGLTQLQRYDHPNLNTLCILAYVPKPPTTEDISYTFTTTLSHPLGIVIIFVGSILLIGIIILGITVCFYKKFRRAP